MQNLLEYYNNETPGRLLSKLINSQELKTCFSEYEILDESDRAIILEKIKSIINEDIADLPLLLRGMKKSTLKAKLADKLNSNDSLYDGLFLVGEKAKNFLCKPDEIPHPLKHINATDVNVASWIFDSYSELGGNPPVDLKYFRESANKKAFCNALTENSLFFDYYLFGLHTENSSRLVNFVSTTLSPAIALNNTTKDNLVIFLWLPKNFTLYMNAGKLKTYEKAIIEKKLPVIKDSFFPHEKEFSIKGFIPPHYILCVHDVGENKLVLNPALLVEKADWIEDGLNVNQERFQDFIKTTAYLRFLQLTNNLSFAEKKA
ncbi:hypothetical protein [Chitinophaga varians]|uniref:hypothetical protein n=1 Tax=Chitinophaga varians TaxID=2202339 RepID=UPI00165EE092|nr:hypothetical protein [Chitinophaga varians]MBC9911545.1 hypothetical protein [Chitinophaga varians]